MTQKITPESPKHLLSLYEAALNSHDADNLDALVHADAVFIFTDGTFCGIDAIKKACQKTWDYFSNEIYSIGNLVWLDRTQQTATCTYHIDWSADLDGERQYFKGRGTTVLKNTPNGWQIIHEHLSRMPENC